jgi:hypothetical protein
MYWQLPVFALGVTAAVLAWRCFPQISFADSRSIEQDRYTLRQVLTRRPVNVGEVQALVNKLGEEGTSTDGDANAAFTIGSAFVLLAEQGPADQAVENWKRAHALLVGCDGEKLSDKQDRARLVFRSAKAAAGAGDGDPASLLKALEVVPPGEDPGDRGRLTADLCLRLTPPDVKRAKAELSGYLSGPPRGTPEQAARLKLQLADLCANTNDSEKARSWLREVGENVPTGLRAEAKLRLARLSLAEGDVNEAVKIFQAVDALPGVPPATQAIAQYETGRGLMLLNNPIAARDCFLKASDSPTPAGAAAQARLAELAAKDADPSSGLPHLEAAVKGVKGADEWVNPHLPLADLRATCEALVVACKGAGKHGHAARAAEVYAAVAEPGRDRELWAEVMAAWGNTPGTPDATGKLKQAAGEFARLADARPELERTGLTQKAAAAYQAAGDTARANALLGKLAGSPVAPASVQADALLKEAENLIADGKLDPGVQKLVEVANAGGPAGTRATLRLALLYAAESLRTLAAKPDDAAGKQQMQYAVTLLTQLANKTFTTAEERRPHQEALYELGKLELSRVSLPWLYNPSDAEARFRRLVTEYPGGDFADRGTLYLGIALYDLARPEGGTGVPPADATAKLTEAKKLFASLGAAKNDFARTEGDLWLVQTVLYLNDLTGTVDTGKALADKYKGRPEELIVLNYVVSAHLAGKRPDLAKETVERMQKVFATLPDSAFAGNRREYTKTHWAKELERLRGVVSR